MIHPARTVREAFVEHHRELIELGDELLSLLRAGDCRAVAERWAKLEHDLESHLVIEETELFPKLALAAPSQVAALREEHAQIDRISELGPAIDLRRVSVEAIAAFLERLRAHTARENGLLYAWADRHVSTCDALVERLRRAIARPTRKGVAA